MNYNNDKRVVLTLDAGGTNFEFSAMQSGKTIVESISKASNATNLELCLQTLVDGFTEMKQQLKEEPVAISFAFPGPADYPKGIIGDLPNLPAFRGGVALGPFLNEKFGLPVFINNDGDLYAYGEALGGILPQINEELKQSGNSKRYKNLVGLTIGTGFGAGIVNNNNLLIGDNSIAAEVWLMSNRVNPEFNAEEIVSTRSIIAEYKKESGRDEEDLMPFDIFKIAKGEKDGDAKAALKAFEFFGRGIGDVVANLITLIDGIVVIGGGITGAQELYFPALYAELQKSYTTRNGMVSRPIQKVYNYSNKEEKLAFLKTKSKSISVPGSTNTISYDPVAQTIIAHSEIGASKAIQLGAYTYALSKLDEAN